MDNNQAKKLIKETFEYKFDELRFKRFIVELLNLSNNSIADAGFSFNTDNIPNRFVPFIDSFEKITSYKTDNCLIDILIIKLKKESSIEHARTMQRNFISWYLRGGCDNDQKDAALAALVSPDENDWRFSLVKMDYSISEDKQGRLRISEEFTPAKRWSFLVGINEKSHTAQSQLINILKKDEEDISLNQLEEAFNVEKVTKEFFEKYRELFFTTKEALDEIIKNNKKIKEEFESKGINTIDFSKKLLGQIVFLYFLQKKGWFGVKRNALWGTGPKNFIRELFEGKHGKYKNFFNDILEPLFYEALRNDRSYDDGYYSRFDCKIPFLNGGLFDPICDYDWVETEININNELFSNSELIKNGDKGTGILDIFDRYNFTVKEDEPLEKEVAVDPEMLGKVFENLLEIKDRKSKGSYYTPREIVHYMCQKSLINYLYSGLEEYTTKDDIEKTIKYSEQLAGDYEKINNLIFIPENIIKNAKLIDKKLSSIKVCDPAAGSGAFLVGMMGEILRTRNVLSKYIKDSKRSIYNFKRDCIENSLYGVDIDHGAVEICKLRLWLSLIVDEEDIKKIKPLPNLDYKIICGNSLLEVDLNLFNQRDFNQLENLKPLYFKETDISKKRKLKKQIDYLIDRITNGHREFDFKVYFSEIFHKNNGFDVVIANPPYLKERDNRNVFKEVNNSAFGKKHHQGKMDFWYYFLHKAIDLVKQKGVISFITSRYWLNSIGASKLINRVNKELSFLDFVDIGKLKVFDAVAGQHMVAVYKKTKEIDEFIYKKLENDIYDINKNINTNNILIKKLSNKKIFTRTNEIILDNFYQEFSNIIPLVKIADVSQGVVEATDKISKRQIARFNNIHNINVGDGVFVLKESELKKLNLNGIEETILKKYLDSNDVSKYSLNWSRKYLVYSDKEIKEKIENDDNFINIKRHLDKYKNFITSSNKPYGLHRPRNLKYFINPKIIFKNMFINNEFIFDDQNYFVGFSFSLIIQKDINYDLRYILAILNSSFALEWFYKNGKKRGGGVDIGVEKLRSFPIKKIEKNKQKQFIDIVNKIMDIKSSNVFLKDLKIKNQVNEYEKIIDNLVYDIYEIPKENREINT